MNYWNFRLVVSLFIAIVVWLLWAGLEIVFYGEIQPRIVDDIIGLILMVSLCKNVEHKYLSRKPMSIKE